jgi:hypothetical protein
MLITVGSYTEELQQKIAKGEVVKSVGGVAFEDIFEAISWANNRFGVGKYQLYKLGEHSKEDYVSTATTNYPTMKKLLKEIKIGDVIKLV